MVDRQLLLGADAQRLVQLAASLQDVGDAAAGDGELVLVVGAAPFDLARTLEGGRCGVEVASLPLPVALGKQELAQLAEVLGFGVGAV